MSAYIANGDGQSAEGTYKLYSAWVYGFTAYQIKNNEETFFIDTLFQAKLWCLPAFALFHQVLFDLAYFCLRPMWYTPLRVANISHFCWCDIWYFRTPGGVAFKESLRFSCIKIQNLWPDHLWRNWRAAPSFPNPKGKQTNKKSPQKTTNQTKHPQMCYLLIICDFQTLFPWGTQLTDFSANKRWFYLRTNSLLISKAWLAH